MGDTGDSAPSTGPPDRQTLQLLDRCLSGHPLVSATEFNPDSYEPRLLRARLDDEQLSDAVAAARLDPVAHDWQLFVSLCRDPPR